MNPAALLSFVSRLLLVGGTIAGGSSMAWAQGTPAAGPFPNAKTKGQSPEAAATLVIYNRADPASEDLARYYGERRQIADDHLLGLDCPLAEEISREDYDEKIADPLRLAFDLHGWWKATGTGADVRVEQNAIRFVAIMRGVPLKIAATANYPGDRPNGPPPINGRNEAAVDSELALLGTHTRSISGALNNAYYRSFTRIGDAAVPMLMLVCRLDGPSADIVRRMIDDSLETERHGLWGFAYVDSRNLTEGALMEGDQWLLKLSEDTRRRGIPVVVDSGPEMFPEGYPMRNAAFYYGWYNETVNGPFLRDDFRFNKGAVAVHIHSFSGASLRNPNQAWAAPLVARGAAATLGNVYEPYLSLTPNVDVFHQRLLDGFTFAESAYMSMRALSWMTTFVGDPLYKPFRLIEDAAAGRDKTAAEFRAYRAGARLWFTENRAAGERRLLQSAKSLRSGIIYEAVASLQVFSKDPVAALASFKQARELYQHPEDILRVTIREASLLRAMRKNQEALKLVRRQLQVFPSSPSAPVLRSLEVQLAAAG